MKRKEPGLFDLKWHIDTAGYEITNDGLIRGKSGSFKHYNPFDKSLGIARSFAKIPFDLETKTISHEAVIKFANQYGLLGLSIDIESTADWYESVLLFWEICSLHDAKGHLANELNNHAVMVFNQLAPKPHLRLSISPGNRPWFRNLEIAPVNLYGAMWIMLAGEISKGINLKKCISSHCDDWFSGRANQKYCSEACKQAAYRNRV